MNPKFDGQLLARGSVSAAGDSERERVGGREYVWKRDREMYRPLHTSYLSKYTPPPPPAGHMFDVAGWMEPLNPKP